MPRKLPPFAKFVAVRYKRRGNTIIDAAEIRAADADPVGEATALLVARHWRGGVPARAGYPHDKALAARPSMEWCTLKVRGYAGATLDAVAAAERGACTWSKTAPVAVNPAYTKRLVEDWDRGRGADAPLPPLRVSAARQR
jgi:hypothetical protein